MYKLATTSNKYCSRQQQHRRNNNNSNKNDTNTQSQGVLKSMTCFSLLPRSEITYTSLAFSDLYGFYIRPILLRLFAADVESNIRMARYWQRETRAIGKSFAISSMTRFGSANMDRWVRKTKLRRPIIMCI